MSYSIYNIDSENKIDENKGTKEKYWFTLNNRKALIKINKYDSNKETRSYNVSEKICSEIAHFLGFSCVDTDFIVDGKCYGIASYDYKEIDDNMFIISGDDLFLSAFGRKSNKKNDKNITEEDYSYNNIIKILLHFDSSGRLLEKFNSIMVMDALTGESDRHFENWGIYYLENGDYNLLPMYDNSSCLLHQFRDNEILERTMSKKNLESYIRSAKAKCKISIEGKLYNHFDFIDYLLNKLPNNLKETLIKDIKRLELLKNSKIHEIVDEVPECFCSRNHKDLIIEYIMLRRDILLERVKDL